MRASDGRSSIWQMETCYRKHVHNGGFFFLFLKHTDKASFIGNKILIAVEHWKIAVARTHVHGCLACSHFSRGIVTKKKKIHSWLRNGNTIQQSLGHLFSWAKSALVWEAWRCPRLDIQEETIAHHGGSLRTVIACRESIRHLACWQQKWFSDVVFSDSKQWNGGRTFLTDRIKEGQGATECCIFCLYGVLQFSRLIFKQHGPWGRAKRSSLSSETCAAL